MSVVRCTSIPTKSGLQLYFSLATEQQRKSQMCLFYCIFPLSEVEQREIEQASDSDERNALALFAVDQRGLSSMLASGGAGLVSTVLRSTFVASRPDRCGRSVLRSIHFDSPAASLLMAQGASGQSAVAGSSKRPLTYIGNAVVNSYPGKLQTSVIIVTVCDTTNGSPVPLGENGSHVLCCFLHSESASEKLLTLSATSPDVTTSSGAHFSSFPQPAIHPLNISRDWCPLMKPRRLSTILLSTAHVAELASKFHKYVVGSASSKVCAIRAARLVIPISVPDGFCSAESSSFMSFLTDSQSVTAIHCGAGQQHAAFEPLPPISVLNVLLRHCRGETVASTIQPRLGLGLRQALEMGADHASFEVEWYDYLLLATVPAQHWGPLNLLVDRHFDLVETAGSSSNAVLNGTPVPATHQAFCNALTHIFNVADVLRPATTSPAEFRARLVQFFATDPNDMGSILSSRRSFRDHLHGPLSHRNSARLSMALDSSHQQEIPMWKRILCCDSGRRRDMRNLLGDIKVTPARLLMCLFPLAAQTLAVSQVDRPDRPLLVPKPRALQFVRLRSVAAHQERGTLQRIMTVFFGKFLRFARLRKEILRRRHLLAQSLQRRIESRSAQPWFSTWRRFAAAKTSKRKNSMMYISIFQKDELLSVRIMFQQWRTVTLSKRLSRKNTRRELMKMTWGRWLAFVECRMWSRTREVAASSHNPSPHPSRGIPSRPSSASLKRSFSSASVTEAPSRRGSLTMM
jgi:hypothetical protein